MCAFHVTSNFKFLRLVRSLCLLCGNRKYAEARRHDYFVQLCFFDTWQVLSKCLQDGWKDRRRDGGIEGS